jgi:dolichol-phosphate mannosyltransferase
MADKKPKIFIVVPAYNEEEGLPRVLDEITSVLDKDGYERLFIVVNDGSKDRTQEIAEEYATRLPVEIIRHPTNLNVGAVFRDGLTRAAELAGPDDILLTTEGDNTCEPSIFTDMIRYIRKGADAVAATRYDKGGRIEGFPPMRRLYSWGINTMLRVMYPIKGISDYSIFMRAYRADLIQRSIAHYGQDWIESVGFVANAEILIKARVFKPRCASAPMLYRYGVKAGGSKLNVKKTILGYFEFFQRLKKTAAKYGKKPLPPSRSAKAKN